MRLTVPLRETEPESPDTPWNNHLSEYMYAQIHATGCASNPEAFT